MATYTIYGSTDDGGVSEDAVSPYSSIDVDGGSLPTPSVDTTATIEAVKRDNNTGSDYDIDQVFLIFDTSSLFGPTTATLNCYMDPAPAAIGTQQVRLLDHDWTPPLAAADFLGSSSFSSYTNLGTVSVGAADARALKSYSIASASSVINTGNSATTAFHLVCDNQATAPDTTTDATDVDIDLADTAGTTSDPYITGNDADPDTLVPDSDNSIGSWTTQAGGTTNLYQTIDEATASDADYVRSTTSPSTDTLKVGLSNPTAGVDTSSPVKIAARYQKSVESETVNLVIKLVEGTTTRVTRTQNGISATWTDFSYTLTSGEKSSITDWDNLFLQFEATQA
jgi:hypothetical protein